MDRVLDLCSQDYCRRLPARHGASAKLADSQYLHNQADGGKNAHHHDGET